MKKIIIGIVLIVLGFILITLSKKEQPNEKPTVKIGVTLPLTGNFSVAGQPANAALLMAITEWKEKRTKYNYELIIEDNAFQSKSVSMNFNKLKNLDKVDAMISFFSMPGKIFAESNKNSKDPVPHISCSWGNSVLEGDYNFNNVSSDETFVEVITNKLKKENVKRIGFVNMNAAFAYEMQEVMNKQLKKDGITLVFDEKFNPGEKDYRSLLSKIKNKNVDIIFVQLVTTDFQLFYQQMLEMGINVPITTVNRISELDDKTPFEGKWYVTNTVVDEVIGNKFNRETGFIPQSCTLNTYDSLNILIHAFENAKTSGNKPNKEEVLSSIKSIKTWNGGSGKLTLLDNGRIDYRPKLVTIKNGKVELLEE